MPQAQCIAQDQPAALSYPQVHLTASRDELLAYFENTWWLTELLFSGLKNEEAYYVRPYHKLRHPMIFYFGHPASLYVNKLRVAGLLDKPVNAEFEVLFETGVDEMRWDDLHESNQHIWPKLDQVRAYRAQVYSIVKELILTHPMLSKEHMPITQSHPFWALVMGFEHERIHLETSSVLMRELPIDYVQTPRGWPETIAHAKPSENAWIEMPFSVVSIGKPQHFPTFGWDNEYGHEQRSVPAFAASECLISNAEFLEFVKDGGYTSARFWSREGWQWRTFRNSKWPSFWVQNGPAGSHLYKLRTIFEVVEMPWQAPVCVNFHEAKAYCAWRSEKESATIRLLTEAEHNAIRDDKAHEYNLNLITGAETPVKAFAPNSKGFYDVFGNLWQWCEDHFHPLEGSAVHSYYDDFSTPCYDGQHQMILGGSFISTGDEASPHARFHFRPHFFQHAGFRIVKSSSPAPAKYIASQQAPYETTAMLNNYMLMHWGAENDISPPAFAQQGLMPKVENLPLKCAELVARFASNHGKALDLGCAVGRSSFELARTFNEVVGIDYSEAFIHAANVLQSDGKLSYLRKESGNASTTLYAEVASEIERQRLNFLQADAMALPESIHNFDAVLLANVLCRLPNPATFLKRMQDNAALVKPGGILVMTTPFSWLEQYTSQEHWLTDLNAVGKILDEFTLIHTEEVPFLIREHARKYEFIITQASVWRRAV